jgi:hypothetical protein
MKMMNKHQSSELEIIAAAVIVATILALSVLVVVTQQEASALASTRFSFNQIKENRCSGFADCSNTGTIKFGLGGGDRPNH